MDLFVNFCMITKILYNGFRHEGIYRALASCLEFLIRNENAVRPLLLVQSFEIMSPRGAPLAKFHPVFLPRVTKLYLAYGAYFEAFLEANFSGRDFFWTGISLDGNFSGREFLWTGIFLDGNFSGQGFFWTRIFLDGDFSGRFLGFF